MSGLVILAESVFEISFGKTDRQTPLETLPLATNVGVGEKWQSEQSNSLNEKDSKQCGLLHVTLNTMSSTQH